MICYFDNSATTRPLDEVIDYMSQLQRDCYGNPSSLHTIGIKAEKVINLARERISHILGVFPKEIIFTSGATESNNLAIKGFLFRNKRLGKRIITTKMEHPSVLDVFESLAREGYDVVYVDIKEDGIIDLDALEKLIDNNTALVSVMHVNNETGAIQPIWLVKSIMNRKGCKGAFHVDAAQGFCKSELLPKKWGVDLLTISSHKIHGPKGVGALYLDPKVKINPILEGGGQELSFRSGTENVPAIGGFGLAAKLCSEKLDSKEITELKNSLITKLEKEDLDFTINSNSDASPFIINVSFPGIRSEIMLHHLEAEGVFVSSGSACSNRRNSKNHVLLAMGKSLPVIDSAIRISFGFYNCMEQLDYAAEKIVSLSNSLRRNK